MPKVRQDNTTYARSYKVKDVQADYCSIYLFLFIYLFFNFWSKQFVHSFGRKITWRRM